MAYFGEYSYSLDSANRVIAPSRFREQLGAEAILYRAPEGCLFLYDAPGFEQILASVKGYAKTELGREKLRLFYSDVSAVSVDRNGRFVIPAECIAHAGLKDDVIILGVNNHIELWDKAEYQKKLGGKEDASEAEYPEIEF